ncbi:peptidyl-prolyl cis-trans isomerase FKBP8 [Coccinella septempunctata]|uniref:peptidyl-prolyl cis-trans isomerase FKBP8 n=1 Tax=Coccinella septempunctata TaxID=41139 RepID=UPI001D08A8E7|nr:peptidyl-prolyl cis-trans isomerase FKBP8 [Coccinella septempunctata]
MSIENEETNKQEVCQESAASKTENDLNKENVESERVQDEWIDILGSGVIMKKILKEGTPDTRPQKQQTCVINYELFVEEDDIIQKEENFEIDLGDNDVIQGLDVSIGLMNVGETCILKIQPRLAFGSKGLPPKIGPDTTVSYKIELISVAEEELESMSITQRKIKGNKKRERGNYWYGRGENSIAIQCYRKALDYLDEVEGGIKFPESNDELSDSALQELLEDRISVYNNMAAAQIRMESYDAALISLKTVLKCQPHNIKALFRQAKVNTAKNDIGSAMKSLLKAKEVSPADPDINNELTKLNKIIEKQKKTERELAKRMFGSNSTKQGKNEQQNSKNVYYWATIAASVAVAVAGLASYRLKYF